jgi:hypothetical protein
MATKTTKLGIAPTLVVLILVLGLAVFVGVILLMMLVRTGIAHSPEQSKVEQDLLFPSGKQALLIQPSEVLEIHES